MLQMILSNLNHIELIWQPLVWVIPLPLIVMLLPKAKARSQSALKVPFYASMGFTTGTDERSTNRFRLILSLVCWLLLVLAAMRPQFVGDPISLPRSARDLLMAVDISGSMETADMELSRQKVSRLLAVKAVAGEFIERRVGDRLGLILFGQQAYLQTPLTFDRETLKTLLYEAEIGLAGKQTAIGDAIGLAVKRLRTQKTEDRVLILLTDGANTAGAVDPLKASELAAQEGLRIYTVGIGADKMTMRSLFGTRVVNPSADLDEDTLTQIAQNTGGRYFRAMDTQQLVQIYKTLDQLEPSAKDEETFRPITELYHWPLAVGFILVLFLTLLETGILVRAFHKITNRVN